VYAVIVNIKVKVSVQFNNQIFKLVLKRWRKKVHKYSLKDRGKQ